MAHKFKAYLDEMKKITILVDKSYHGGHLSKFLLQGEKDQQPLVIQQTIDLHHQMKYICFCEKEPEIGKFYWVMDEYGEKTELLIGSVIRTKEFDEKFYYDGPLGNIYGKEGTTFKVWAPTATSVKLKLYTPDEEEYVTLQMSRGEKGVWSIHVKGDLDRYCYTYLVCVNLVWREAVDPYTLSVTANGKLGVIIDLQKTIVEKVSPSPLTSFVDAIIYEVHLRDFTIHENSGIKNKGTYVGAAERNTVGKDHIPTGLSYVKDLGVTHIEFLPVHDFEGVDELGNKEDYNWGYNPLHFNAPDGSYSTDPKDPYARVIELKKLIQAVHKEGLRVILDVVYNHVYEKEESSFEKIVPGYYFRYDEFGFPSNGTGVGNDIASERQMVRRFILDSVKYWKEEYDVDGFRFDLMGILDVETMNLIRNTIDEIDPQTIIIGEGWDLNTPLPREEKAAIHNQKRLPRIGQFNDWFRDTIKGSTFDLPDKGYILGNDRYYDDAKQVIAASIGLPPLKEGRFSQPEQSVNYVESHDNHTLWDKLIISVPLEPVEKRKKIHLLGTTIVLLSQGIPFLHSGQEFFRTKGGEGNSYRSSNWINQLNWDECAENQHYVKFVRGIIALRKSHRAFRLTTRDQIRQHLIFLDKVEKPIIGYCLKEVGHLGKWNDILVFFNPAHEEMEVEIPKCEWHILVNGEKASSEPIGKWNHHRLILPPISTYVLAK